MQVEVKLDDWEEVKLEPIRHEKPTGAHEISFAETLFRLEELLARVQRPEVKAVLEDAYAGVSQLWVLAGLTRERTLAG